MNLRWGIDRYNVKRVTLFLIVWEYQPKKYLNQSTTLTTYYYCWRLRIPTISILESGTRSKHNVQIDPWRKCPWELGATWIARNVVIRRNEDHKTKVRFPGLKIREYMIGYCSKLRIWIIANQIPLRVIISRE